MYQQVWKIMQLYSNIFWNVPLLTKSLELFDFYLCPILKRGKCQHTYLYFQICLIYQLKRWQKCLVSCGDVMRLNKKVKSGDNTSPFPFTVALEFFILSEKRRHQVGTFWTGNFNLFSCPRSLLKSSHVFMYVFPFFPHSISTSIIFICDCIFLSLSLRLTLPSFICSFEEPRKSFK